MGWRFRKSIKRKRVRLKKVKRPESVSVVSFRVELGQRAIQLSSIPGTGLYLLSQKREEQTLKSNYFTNDCSRYRKTTKPDMLSPELRIKPHISSHQLYHLFDFLAAYA